MKRNYFLFAQSHASSLYKSHSYYGPNHVVQVNCRPKVNLFVEFLGCQDSSWQFFVSYYQQFLVLIKTAQFLLNMIWPHISHTFQLPSTQIVSKYVLPIMISTYPSLSKYSSSMVKLSKMCYTWIDHLLFLRSHDFVRPNKIVRKIFNESAILL